MASPRLAGARTRQPYASRFGPGATKHVTKWLADIPLAWRGID